jgi:hypothetical protein
MDDLKPWHIAILVIGLCVLTGGVYFSIRSSGTTVDLAESMVMADVVSGELFEVTLPERGITIPFKHPTTGSYTLYPVAKDESGRWVIPSRYLGSAVASKDPKPLALKDAKSGEVTLKSETPTKIKATK